MHLWQLGYVLLSVSAALERTEVTNPEGLPIPPGWHLATESKEPDVRRPAATRGSRTSDVGRLPDAQDSPSKVGASGTAQQRLSLRGKARSVEKSEITPNDLGIVDDLETFVFREPVVEQTESFVRERQVEESSVKNMTSVSCLAWKLSGHRQPCSSKPTASSDSPAKPASRPEIPQPSGAHRHPPRRTGHQHHEQQVLHVRPSAVSVVAGVDVLAVETPDGGI
mmetsp:Transcript_51547/g.137584  ORF Transcript_51547/g.137584 Transcript_51547/m.137584 type:complete len:224 (-) Transcript_51547:48-719(-)